MLKLNLKSFSLVAANIYYDDIIMLCCLWQKQLYPEREKEREKSEKKAQREDKAKMEQEAELEQYKQE